MFISGTSVLLALIIGCLAAYGFSRYPLKGNDTYLFIILTTRMMPAIVVIIPIFLMFRLTGWPAPMPASSCYTLPSTSRSRSG